MFIWYRFGGWVVDGFPETRENWAAMIESNLLPDSVLSIEDDLAPTDFLLARFAAMNGLPDPSILKVSATQQQQEGEAVRLVYLCFAYLVMYDSRLCVCIV